MTISGDEASARCTMALAEMGYTDVRVTPQEPDDQGRICLRIRFSKGLKIPNAVVWKALNISGVHTACWFCFNQYYGDSKTVPYFFEFMRCYNGNCLHPAELKIVPTELLVPRRA